MVPVDKNPVCKRSNAHGATGGTAVGTLEFALWRGLRCLAPCLPRPGRISQIYARNHLPLMIHYAGLDKRINEGWEAYSNALKEHQKQVSLHFYPDVNHAFHNDTSPRYDKDAAALAWTRTLNFLKPETKLKLRYPRIAQPIEIRHVIARF